MERSRVRGRTRVVTWTQVRFPCAFSLFLSSPSSSFSRVFHCMYDCAQPQRYVIPGVRVTRRTANRIYRAPVLFHSRESLRTAAPLKTRLPFSLFEKRVSPSFLEAKVSSFLSWPGRIGKRDRRFCLGGHARRGVSSSRL